MVIETRLEEAKAKGAGTEAASSLLEEEDASPDSPELKKDFTQIES